MIYPNSISLGDCLALLPGIKDRSVDLVVCDLPYRFTQAHWDLPLDLAALWDQLDRVRKPNAPIIFFAAGRFLIDLLTSRPNEFRYDLVWHKGRSTNPLNSNLRPLPVHENLLVFYDKQPTYNPQFVNGRPNHGQTQLSRVNRTYGKWKREVKIGKPYKYPKSVLHFNRPSMPLVVSQKPVDLLRYLVLTYSNSDDVVLDPACGSGTTLVAAKMEGRAYIGIEMEMGHYQIAKSRLNQLVQTPTLFPDED